ncbi:hypothetical protein [Amnibacterium setariae]|uniref:hypothetical protein n=1 Tax=Amnibacterium setariae TaxID=2306585 RepID=UPI0011C3C622|nr:hypothetical protein [Amnibacterium setariae]
MQLLAQLRSDDEVKSRKFLSSYFNRLLTGPPRSNVQGLPGLQVALLAAAASRALGSRPALPTRWLEASRSGSSYFYSRAEGTSLAADSTASQIFRLTGHNVPAALVTRARLALSHARPTDDNETIFDRDLPSLSILEGEALNEYPQLREVRANVTAWFARFAEEPASFTSISTLSQLHDLSQRRDWALSPLERSYGSTLASNISAGLSADGQGQFDPQVTLLALRMGLEVGSKASITQAVSNGETARGWPSGRVRPSIQSTYMAVESLLICGSSIADVGQFVSREIDSISDRTSAVTLYQLHELQVKLHLNLDGSGLARESAYANNLLRIATSQGDGLAVALSLIVLDRAPTSAQARAVQSSSDIRSIGAMAALARRLHRPDLETSAQKSIARFKESTNTYRFATDLKGADLFSTAIGLSASGAAADKPIRVLNSFRGKGNLWTLTMPPSASPVNLLSLYSAASVERVAQLDYVVSAVG